MTASRTQHLAASSVILAVALTVGWVSFTQQPEEAFLFPRLISVFFGIFALWNFIRAVMGLSKVGEGLDGATVRAIIPGLIVMLIYIFWAAKGYGKIATLEGHWSYDWVRRGMGFYASSTLAFFTLYTLYDPAPRTELKGWAKRIIVTAIFMAIIYGLFALLLKVQTPRGMIF